MEVPGRSQAPPHGYSLVSDGDYYDFRGFRNEEHVEDEDREVGDDGDDNGDGGDDGDGDGDDEDREAGNNEAGQDGFHMQMSARPTQSLDPTKAYKVAPLLIPNNKSNQDDLSLENLSMFIVPPRYLLSFLFFSLFHNLLQLKVLLEDRWPMITNYPSHLNPTQAQNDFWRTRTTSNELRWTKLNYEVLKQKEQLG